MGVSAGSTLWCIDPLDGTTNFVHGYAPFAISVAALRRVPLPQDRWAWQPQAACVVEFVCGTGGASLGWPTRVFSACAGLGAMLAMDGLGFGVGYMLCTNGAILVNGAWSVGYYREISGRRDLALFGGAFALNLAASAIIAEHRSLCLVTSALANAGHAPDEALGDVLVGGERYS